MDIKLITYQQIYTVLTLQFPVTHRLHSRINTGGWSIAMNSRSLQFRLPDKLIESALRIVVCIIKSSWIFILPRVGPGRLVCTRARFRELNGIFVGEATRYLYIFASWQERRKLRGELLVETIDILCGYMYLCGDRDVDILSTANTARYLGPSLGLYSNLKVK